LRAPGHFAQRSVDDRAAMDAYQAAALAPADQVDGSGAEAARENAVVRAGRAAALHVTEPRHAQLHADGRGMLLEVLQQLIGVVFRTFGNHDDRVFLAALS